MEFILTISDATKFNNRSERYDSYEELAMRRDYVGSIDKAAQLHVESVDTDGNWEVL